MVYNVVGKLGFFVKLVKIEVFYNWKKICLLFSDWSGEEEECCSKCRIGREKGERKEVCI